MNRVKVTKRKAGSYENGWRYCSKCELYLYTDSRVCPFCGNPLRSSPRKKKYLDKVKRVDPIKYGIEVD